MESEVVVNENACFRSRNIGKITEDEQYMVNVKWSR